MNKELLKYIETKIIPRYEKNDKAHNINHVRSVIANSISIAENHNVDKNIVYTAAAYHDLGLEVERERHEVFSKEIMLNDKKLDEIFNRREKELIADADRDLIPVNIIERTILFSLDKFPEYDRKDHFIRSREHIENKYGKEGYINLWLDSEVNNKNLEKLRKLIDNKSRFERVFDYYFNKHVNQ